MHREPLGKAFKEISLQPEIITKLTKPSGKDWGVGAGGEGDYRGWDGWMASPTRWTWFGWTPGVGDGQEGLACCSSWGLKESDMTERLNWTELNWSILKTCIFLNWHDQISVGPSFSFSRYNWQIFLRIYIGRIYLSSRASIVKYHTLGSLVTSIYVPTVPEARSLRARCVHSWFLLSHLSLACRYSCYSYFFIWCSLCVCVYPNLL